MNLNLGLMFEKAELVETGRQRCRWTRVPASVQFRFSFLLSVSLLQWRSIGLSRMRSAHMGAHTELKTAEAELYGIGSGEIERLATAHSARMAPSISTALCNILA